MLTITSREDISLAVDQRVTVYRHAPTRRDHAHRAQYVSLSQPSPDQTAHGPLTVSHDASAHHSKRARALWECRPTRRDILWRWSLPKLLHHAEGLVPRRRSKSRRRVSVYRCRSVTPITTQVCLENTHVLQTIKTGKLTTIITRSFELIGRRPAYQSGRPGLY